MSHAHRFTDWRNPQPGRLQAQTDTMGVFLRWGWSEVEHFHSQEESPWPTGDLLKGILTCWCKKWDGAGLAPICFCCHLQLYCFLLPLKSLPTGRMQSVTKHMGLLICGNLTCWTYRCSSSYWAYSIYRTAETRQMQDCCYSLLDSHNYTAFNTNHWDLQCIVCLNGLLLIRTFSYFLK